MKSKIRKFKKKYKRWRMYLKDKINFMIFYLFPFCRAVNKKEYKVVGLMRSGNHAVINWIFSQLDSPKCFLNYIEEGKNPFIYFKSKGTLRQFPQDYFKKNSLRTQQLGCIKNKNALIYSFEDAFLSDVFSDLLKRNHNRWVGKSKQCFNILLLRDPYNLFASRLKREELYPNRYSLREHFDQEKVLSIWKEYAKEFLNITNDIPSEKIVINYNRWTSSCEYRKAIANQLNVDNFSDDMKNELLLIGGGSSFNQDNKMPSQEQLESRWKMYENDEVFIELFRDSEINELSDQIFGDIPGVKEWLLTHKIY